MEVCLSRLTDLGASGQVSCCRREEVGEHIGLTDLAVPLMARLDSQMLDSAPRLKAILQYGVGVEGVDIPAVDSLIPPSHTTFLGYNQHKSCSAWHLVYQDQVSHLSGNKLTS